MSRVSEYQEKMERAQANPSAIKCFLRAYELLSSGQNFEIPEESIEPVKDLVELSSLPESVPHQELATLLSQTAVIKLNGGLGTGMGLQKAKSLLEVKDGKTFLDLILKQTASAAEGEGPTFLLMNSFSTSEDTLSFLKEHYPAYSEHREVEILQNFNPKVLQKDLSPAYWEADPSLEWCPPGHGDLYTALSGSGWLDRLAQRGIRYLFVSNSDNLGAVVDPQLLSYFAELDAPFLMEVTARTAADRKGGHLAARSADGQLVLREIAQCPEEDADSFQDTQKHRYFNTNNLWLRLEPLRAELERNEGFLPLPVITNRKTLDPRDKTSPAVYQLETAMGAAVECFPGAEAVCVPRNRFAPVKTTADLLSLRSDAYQILPDGRITLIESRGGIPPHVNLSEHYKFSDQLSTLGVPSLKDATSLEVDGPVRFEDGVIIQGDVIIHNDSEEVYVVESGVYKDCELTPS